MIINIPGATFEYDGVTYTVGAPIVGTAESEYEGLYGSITEIIDGDDKETENETPDIYCEFEPPVLPSEVKRLEKIFSDLYCMPKAIDEIILDMVIMAPSMIRPLEDLHAVRKHIQVYIVEEEWAVDGEHGNSCELFADYDDAKRFMAEKLKEELDDGAIPRWSDRKGFISNDSKDFYEAYIDGEFMENHYRIIIMRQPLLLSMQSAAEVSKLLPKEKPLLAFIKEEVPFRLKEMFGWLPNEAITDDVISACVDELWSDSDVMFAYDAMDNVIARVLNNLGIREDEIVLDTLDEDSRNEL